MGTLLPMIGLVVLSSCVGSDDSALSGTQQAHQSPNHPQGKKIDITSEMPGGSPSTAGASCQALLESGVTLSGVHYGMMATRRGSGLLTRAWLSLVGCGGGDPQPPAESCTARGTAAPAFVALTPTIPGRSDELLADADNLYWSNTQYTANGYTRRLLKVPKGGGAPIELAIGLHRTDYYSLALDDGYVYWADVIGSPGIYRVSKTGGTPDKLYTPAANDLVTNLATDGVNVYFATFRDHALWRLRLGDSMPQFLGQDTEGPIIVRVDGQDVFWGNKGVGLGTIPMSGGSPMSLSTATGNSTGLVVDGGTLFWASVGLSGTASGVFAVPRLGGGAIPLYTAAACGVATDSSYAYLIACGSGSGTLMRAPKDGSAAAQPLPSAAMNDISSLALDDSHIFVTTASQVWSLGYTCP